MENNNVFLKKKKGVRSDYKIIRLLQGPRPPLTSPQLRPYWSHNSHANDTTLDLSNEILGTPKYYFKFIVFATCGFQDPTRTW